MLFFIACLTFPQGSVVGQNSSALPLGFSNNFQETYRSVPNLDVKQDATTPAHGSTSIPSLLLFAYWWSTGKHLGIHSSPHITKEAHRKHGTLSFLKEKAWAPPSPSPKSVCFHSFSLSEWNRCWHRLPEEVRMSHPQMLKANSSWGWWALTSLQTQGIYDIKDCIKDSMIIFCSSMQVQTSTNTWTYLLPIQNFILRPHISILLPMPSIAHSTYSSISRRTMSNTLQSLFHLHLSTKLVILKNEIRFIWQDLYSINLSGMYCILALILYQLNFKPAPQLFSLSR